jgi:translation initiation factor IF-1
LLWILEGDQKVGMNITGWSKSCYEYYRATKKVVWILQGDHKVSVNITGWSKVGMNITGWSKSCNEYYRMIKKLVWILQGDQKVAQNITGRPISWYEYYRVIKELICIFSMLPCYDACNNWLVFFFFRLFVLCKSQNKMKTENKVPNSFKWLETNLYCLVFDFTSVTNIIREGAFSEISLWNTSTVKVEIQFYFMSDIERMKCSGIVSKILKSSPKDSDIEN